MDSRNPQAGNVLSGTAVSGGIAGGFAHLFFNTDIHAPLNCGFSKDQAMDGWGQIEKAIQRQLQKLKDRILHAEFGEDSSVFPIMKSYQVFLNDPLLHATLRDELQRNGDCAPVAVRSAFRKWIRKFKQLPQHQMKAKALLLADLGKMLLESLADAAGTARLPAFGNKVLVADHLFVSDIVALQQNRPAAIVLQHGHPASHGLILARELEIPILCHVPDALQIIRPDVPVIVDADRSRILVHHVQTLEEYQRSVEPLPIGSGMADLPVDIEEPPVRVMADVGSPAASVRAAEVGADGIGLLRMEALYMQSDRALREEEIVERLSEILAPMEGKPMYVRLLDIGGDKPLPYVKDSQGGTSMTGYRGVRLLAAHPELLDPQIKALLKLSLRFDLRILVPMVTVTEDMRLVRDALESAARVAGVATPPLGAMVETPAAALMAGELWEWCDFLRIGSNDLTQYVMAASRDNPLGSHYFQQTHPAVLKLVGMVCRSGNLDSIGLCGALADSVDMVPQLFELGVREVVVPPESIGPIRRAIHDLGRPGETARGAEETSCK